MALPKEIVDLADLLYSLPGIGPKLSQRLSLYLVSRNKNKAKKIANDINLLVDKIKDCTVCGNVSVLDTCNICIDSFRDNSILWVIEDPLDLYNIELSGEYTGVYHVLNGLISPVNGIGPNDLNIGSLLIRLTKDNAINEIILGLNPNVEGESTTMYIVEEIKRIRQDLKITQLAKGLPTGSDLEFISHQTLLESFRRREII